MLMLGEAMSIRARRTCAPSGKSPFRMRRNRSRLSSAGRSRYGLLRPASVSVPRCSLVSSAVRLSVGLAVADQLLRVLVYLLEVVGRVIHPVGPVEAKPADVLLDRFNMLLTSSFVGSASKRKLQRPLNSPATPKFRTIALAWPMCR